MTKDDEIRGLIDQLNRLPKILFDPGSYTYPRFSVQDGKIAIRVGSGARLVPIEVLQFCCKRCGSTEGLLELGEKEMSLVPCPKCHGREIEVTEKCD